MALPSALLPVDVRDNRVFTSCILSLLASSFGFAVRASLLETLGVAFDLTEGQKGALQGVGLFPFALSIVVFSLVLSRVGHGRAMSVAWALHVLSAIVTIAARSYAALYVGTLLFSLANGTIEAVVNPLTAALYPKDKTARLIVLHSGWAAGLVLGGLSTIALGDLGWRWKIGLLLVPALLYGPMLLGQRFPVPERVAADVSYTDMMKEFGWAGCLVVCTFASYAVHEVALVFGAGILPANHALLAALAYALVPTLYFAVRFRAFGRPMFIFLLFAMILLATTELGTESWISELLTPGLQGVSAQAGTWVLVYTSALMFGLRFFAGRLAHRLGPVGLLIGCSLMAAAGLVWLAHAAAAPLSVFAAATLFGAGTAFFWPTTLGLAAEQFPRGGALTLNAISAVGMISVGILGGPVIGTLQEVSLDQALRSASPALLDGTTGPTQRKFGVDFRPLDQVKIASLSGADRARVHAIISQTDQALLARIAVLPSIMFVGFVGLGLFFRMRGGYRQAELVPR